jgi:hypothetical protein
VPWNVVPIVDGNVDAAALWIADTASPSANPGFRLNEIVTDGSWPVWLTDSGPASVVTFATVFSGTRFPVVDRTYSIDNEAGSF